jgi:glutathione S-transferase
MYTIIGGVRSRAFRVLWMLEELGQPYKHEAAAPRSEGVTAFYPAGKVPILLDGDAVLTDSTAILTYLADKHGALTFPAGTIERAKQDGHTHFILDEMDSLLWTAARHSLILPEDKRVEAIKEPLKWEYESSLERLDTRLGSGPFLMGKTLTVPDLIATHCINWAVSAKFPSPSARVQAYVDDMRARATFQKAASL